MIGPVCRKAGLMLALAGCALSVVPTHVRGQGPEAAKKPAATALPETGSDRFNSRPILTDPQWSKLDRAVDRGLEFIAKRQSADGSFPTHSSGQPAATALCVMAFLSRGHMPDEGRYGKQIARAIDYVLSTQAPDGGIMSEKFPQVRNASFEGNYNHSIAGLMLGEVYGMSKPAQQDRIRVAIQRALDLTRQQQLSPKRDPAEKGGWRYMRRFGVTDSDLSVTAWQLMFLRSAKNAEFDVPSQWVDEAMGYIRRSYDASEGGFLYGLHGEDHYVSRGMAGAGIVCLALGGEHDSTMVRKAGDWILQHNFERYNRTMHPEDRYHYGAFYCSQAMFQLGGDYWFKFFPQLLDTVAQNQRSDGSWDAESQANDRKYGNVYSTALTVLALTPPYQLLPIYQR